MDGKKTLCILTLLILQETLLQEGGSNPAPLDSPSEKERATTGWSRFFLFLLKKISLTSLQI